jgi:hypothetical protein
MPAGKSKWESVTAPGPDVRQKIERAKNRVPVATVVLKIYSTKPGDSAAEVEVAPQGPFSGRVGRAAAATYAGLANICQRELSTTLGALASAASDSSG